MIQLLLRFYYKNPLLHAVTQGNIPCIKYYLSCINLRDTPEEYHFDLLAKAIQYDTENSSLSITSLLLKYGVNINAEHVKHVALFVSGPDSSAIYEAVKLNNINMVKFLLDNGASPDFELCKVINEGPLDYTILNDNLEMAKLLVLHNAHAYLNSSQTLNNDTAQFVREVQNLDRSFYKVMRNLDGIISEEGLMKIYNISQSLSHLALEVWWDKLQNDFIQLIKSIILDERDNLELLQGKKVHDTIATLKSISEYFIAQQSTIENKQSVLLLNDYTLKCIETYCEPPLSLQTLIIVKISSDPVIRSLAIEKADCISLGFKKIYNSSFIADLDVVKTFEQTIIGNDNE